MATFFSLLAQRKEGKRKGSPGCSLILSPKPFFYESLQNSLRSDNLQTF